MFGFSKVGMTARMMMAATALVACAGSAMAQSGYSIAGGLSNFDVTNHCDHPCDGFEVEIEDVTVTDIFHTYRNGNYGSPRIEAIAGGVRVTYHHPNHLTPVNTIEHYGVSLRNFSPTTVIRVRWMRNGQPALVNGAVPMPDGSSSQASQPRMPSISTENVRLGNGDNVIRLSVTNNDTTQPVWIKRSAQITAGEVTLEQLMPNDPVVTGSVAIDAAPILVMPGVTVTQTGDLFELEDTQSAVFSAEFYQNTRSGGPFGGPQNVRGALLGHVMTASVAARAACGPNGGPVILRQPVSVTDNPGADVTLDVSVNGGEYDPTIEWRKDGVAISVDDPRFEGADTDSLLIPVLVPETEGIYLCVITSPCGRVTTESAFIRIVGDEGGGGGADGCFGDFNNDDFVDPDDLSDYISGYFEAPSNERCDFNHDSTVDPDDLADYIGAFFNGCD